MKIGITGSNGQLGNALQEVLACEELVSVDVDELDITDASAVRNFLENHSLELVINAAAYTQVDRAEGDEENAYRVNALGPKHLAAATAKLKIPILHISTDYVFDGTASIPYCESDLPHPASVYGRTKLAGEEEVRANNANHYIVRTAWLYHTRGENFPKTMIRLARRGGVRVVEDQFGSPTYAVHLARALKSLIQTRNYGTYHIAGSGGASWFEFTKTLFAFLGIVVPVTPVTTAEFPRPAKRPAYAVLATNRDPGIVLPPWRKGLEEFCCAIRSGLEDL